MTGVWRPAAGQTWDRAEFEDLFLSHYEGIYRLLFRMLGSAEEAEDLAQETFLRLYRQRSLEEGAHNVRAWLYRVAVNLAYNATRERVRRERRQRRAASEVQPAMAGADPAEAALRNDERAVVRRALMALPRREAQLLLLYYAGLTYRDLATALGVAPGSVGTMLARAKAAFAKAYRTTAYPRDEGGGDEM